MKTLLKINHIIGKIENTILSFSILGIALLMICNTLGRTLFHHSIHATEELNMILILIVTFVGLSNAARNGRHIIMTAIYDKMPNKAKRISNIITNFVIFALLLWIAYLSIQYTVKVYTYGRITTVLAIPVYLSMAIIPFGCILGALQYLIVGIRSVVDKDILWAGSEKEEELPVDEQVEKLLEEEAAAKNESLEGGKEA